MTAKRVRLPKNVAESHRLRIGGIGSEDGRIASNVGFRHQTLQERTVAAAEAAGVPMLGYPVGSMESLASRSKEDKYTYVR